MGIINERTGVASNQPGYYLATAVAGMVQGLPSQQPLTNLNIVGVQALEFSNFYFDRAQIDALLASGYFVFVQRSKTTAPYALRQITTDVSTLESAELSIVKNFDFVALAYKAGALKFIGTHNIVPDTLSQISTELRAISRQLISARLPNIGAPLVDAEDPVLSVPEGISDRVDVRIDIVLPKPLNQVDLFVTAA